MFPPKSARVVAMTFDDGPTCTPSHPFSNQGVTEAILQAMAGFDARGTFDVIGSTHENYPDKCGKIGTFKWSGFRYDHYPQFGQDSLAGAANQKDLVRKILENGHEISNHGYRHVAFGPERIVYGSRAHFTGRDQVLNDLTRLHNLIKTEFEYDIRLARPPHYIDKILDGTTSYDVYEEMGYQYLGASFDGGGWRASSGDFKKDVEAMVQPLKRALESGSDSLNGHIIFEKDGYNMSLEAPVVCALPEKLKLLKDYDYKVITVSQILELSQFIDVDPSSETYKAILFMINLGKPVAYRDNTFRGDNLCRTSEMEIWLKQQDGPDQFAGQKPLEDSSSFSTGNKTRRKRPLVGPLDPGQDKSPLSVKALSRIARENGLAIPGNWGQTLQDPVSRSQAILAAAEILV